MVKYIKPKMISGQPVWKLPVREGAIYGKGRLCTALRTREHLVLTVSYYLEVGNV